MLSVNHPDEISSLAATYPEISFIANEKDARAISGRRTPYIKVLEDALAKWPDFLEARELMAGLSHGVPRP